MGSQAQDKRQIRRKKSHGSLLGVFSPCASDHVPRDARTELCQLPQFPELCAFFSNDLTQPSRPLRGGTVIGAPSAVIARYCHVPGF